MRSLMVQIYFRKDGAKVPKHSKHILTSFRKTLEEKDSKSSASLPVPSKTDSIFKRRAFNQPKCSLVAKYDEDKVCIMV